MTVTIVIIIILALAMILGGILLIKRTATKFDLSTEELKKIKERSHDLTKKEREEEDN